MIGSISFHQFMHPKPIFLLSKNMYTVLPYINTVLTETVEISKFYTWFQSCIWLPQK